MQKFSLILFLMLGFTLFAQENQSLEVTYIMDMDMDADEIIATIPQEYRAMVESGIRQELADGISIDYTLKTNGKEAVYKMVEQINNAQTAGGMIAAQIRASDNQETYINMDEKFYLKPVDVMGTRYMIKDVMQDHKWNITREKTEIAGYETRYATGEMTMNDSIIPIKAWFAPKIPVKSGPSSLWGLPGLILKAEFESNGALMTLTAKEIKVLDQPLAIKPPTGGKEVTLDEFTNEMKKIQEEYQEAMGGGVDTE